MKRLWLVAIIPLFLGACSQGAPTAPADTSPAPVATTQVEATVVPIVAEQTAAPEPTGVPAPPFSDRAIAVLNEQQAIMVDLAAECDAASQESSLAGIQAHGPAFRALQARWLATGTSMDNLRPVPPEMQQAYALWVQAYSQGAQALDSIAEGAETLNLVLIDDATTHLEQATSLIGQAADALSE